MSNKTETRYLGVKETLAYGFANAGRVFGYNLFAGGYLSLFFIKVFGIPEKAVATMILIIGLWGAIKDPVIGGLVDRTRTRYGKLRPYFFLVPLPLAVATIFVFSGPEILSDAKTATSKVVYMYISYFIWELFYSFGDIPFWGMSAAISPSAKDRTRAVSSARFLASFVGGISLALIPVMMDLTNKDIWKLTLSQDFRILAVIAAVLLIILLPIAGIKTKERAFQTVDMPPLKESIQIVLKNKPLMLLIAGNLLAALSGLAAFFQTYYFYDVLNLSSAVIWISLPATLCGYIAYLFIPKLKRKYDNKQLLMMSIMVRFAAGLIVFFAGLGCYNTNAVAISIILIVQNFIFGFLNTINLVIPIEMVGDTVDYMEWKKGERTEGVSFSLYSSSEKLAKTISTSLGTALLPAIGLTIQAVSDGSTLTSKGDNTDIWLWAFYTIIPWTLGLLSLVPYYFYSLSGKKLEAIRSDMAEKRKELSKEFTEGGAENEE